MNRWRRPRRTSQPSRSRARIPPTRSTGSSPSTRGTGTTPSTRGTGSTPSTGKTTARMGRSQELAQLEQVAIRVLEETSELATPFRRERRCQELDAPRPERLVGGRAVLDPDGERVV